MKSVTLKERNPKTGRWDKSENYSLVKLKEIIIQENPGYFSHWLWGKTRYRALEIFIYTLGRLIDKDQPGKVKMENR